MRCHRSGTKCTKIAHGHSPAIFHHRRRYRREFCNGNHFLSLFISEDHRSLTIFNRKEIAHCGSLTSHLQAAVPIAATTAENRHDFGSLNPGDFPRNCSTCPLIFEEVYLQKRLRNSWDYLSLLEKFGGFQRGVFVRGANLNNWGGCAHRLQ